MLDGIRDDPDGPKIDLRRDLFSHFTGKVIVVLEPSSIGSKDRWLLLVPLSGSAAPAKVVKKVISYEPGGRFEQHLGLDIGVIGRKPENRICVAANHLLIGDQKLVYAALDRLKKKRRITR